MPLEDFLLLWIDPRREPTQMSHAQNSPFHMPLTSWSACRKCCWPMWWRQASHSLAFQGCRSNTVADPWCRPVLDAVVSQHMPMILSIGIVHSCRVACRASDIVVPSPPWIRGAAKTGHSGYDQGGLSQLPDGPQSHDDAHTLWPCRPCEIKYAQARFLETWSVFHLPWIEQQLAIAYEMYWLIENSHWGSHHLFWQNWKS